MSKKNPELSAVQQIVTALQSLDASVQDRVLASVLALLGKERPGWSEEFQRREDPGQQQDRAPAIRPKGLTELISEKTPGTNSQRIVLFAYYRDKFENRQRFSRVDLKEYFGKARLEPPGNYDRDFNAAVEKGWVHENGDQSYITTSGLEVVEQGFEGERRYAKGRGRKKSGARRATGKGKKSKAKGQ